jgi:hypothetical protein
MTVATELAKRAANLEFILCVEGVGWPGDEYDLTTAWQGTVFATSDTSDLATVLGCSVSTGLKTPPAISETMDPTTLVVRRDGAAFEIVDVDEWWEDNFHPLKTDDFATLDVAISYDDTTIDIDENDKSFSANDVVWFGRTEAIKLGSKASLGGGIWRYTGCTRGYIGTPEGRRDNAAKSTAAFAWEVNTVIRAFNLDWYDRRVLLFAHVPGEARGNALRLYGGRTRNIDSNKVTADWTIETISESMNALRTTYNANYSFEVELQSEYIGSQEWVPPSQINWYEANSVVPPSAYSPARDLEVGSLAGKRRFKVRRKRRRYDIDTHGNDPFKYAYHYRSVSGGSESVMSAGSTTPQTYTSTINGSTVYHIQSSMLIGGHLNWILFKTPPEYIGATETPFNFIFAEAIKPSIGNDFKGKYDESDPIRLMLDNIPNSWRYNRFSVNRVVPQDAIHVLLCFLTSMDGEYFRADASGGTTTTIQFTAPGWSVDQWAGYTVFCPQDSTSGNQGMARGIVSNTTTTLTLDAPLPSAAHSGNEYQIRNSLYDVLPLGYGMGVRHNAIDIDSFTAVRDEFNVSGLGKFSIGEKDGLDLWELIANGICVPRCLSLYVSRTTGKLTLRKIGHEGPDGLKESYTSVTYDEIVEMGDAKLMPRVPVTSYTIRSKSRQVMLYHQWREIATPVGTIGQWEEKETRVSPALPNTDASTVVRLPELERAFPRAEFEQIVIDAPLDSDVEPMVKAFVNRLQETSVPLPEITLLLESSFMANDPPIQPGSILSVSDTTRWKPIDPQAGTRGWTNKLCRVLATRLIFEERRIGLECRVQVLGGTSSALVAPAATVTSKSSYPGGPEYFAVNDNDFTPEGNTAQKDWGLFSVGDQITLFDITGAVKEVEEIESFGQNEAATPATANASTVNVVGTISSAIASGDYISFQSWADTPTDNRGDYCALADSNETLGASNDDAKDYA